MVNVHRAEGAEQTRRNGDIAIIGMACLFPGAPDLDTYWHNIISKVDAVTDPPPESWDPAVFYDPDSDANDRVYCKRGGFISPLAYFDPMEHGIMPKTVEGGEPDQWLALQVARAAFADAGYGDNIPERKRTAVVIGKGTYLNRGNLSAAQHGIVTDQTLAILKTLHPEFTEEDLAEIRKELKQRLPPFNADTASGLVPNILAGRIANRLDLMGPSYTVDAACASSLIAVDIAVSDLLTRRCDLALVGGSHVVTPVPVLMLFCQLGALSRRQQIRPFDRNADGTILGEGVGMAVLKRCADAERDGNRIYAVIKGVGTSSDGRGMSVMAPRLEGQVEAMMRAYQSAGVQPSTVGLIEAHGTATSVGDATEVKALTEVFGLRDTAPPRIGLGSVKSMVGHLMPAAGIAALIKTALALYHKVLPPTLNVDEPNPDLHLEQAPFYINTDTRPWIQAAQSTPRRAGVSAFGFGGINAHVVLEEAPPADLTDFRSRQRSWETEVLVLRGHSREDLVEQTKMLGNFLEKAPDIALRDLAFTLNVTQVDLSRPMCLSLVVSSVQDAREKLDRALKKLADRQISQIKTVDGIYWSGKPLGPTGTLAFLFPGEGSQHVNMLADLCIHFPEVRAQFDQVDRMFAGHVRNYVPSDYLFPSPSFTDEAREAAETRIWQMEGAVEAVLTANRALALVLDRLAIQPAAVVGHSTGEYSAMLASGMIRAGDEAALTEFALGLNRFHQETAGDLGVPSAVLVAVGADTGSVTAAIAELQGQLFVAMDNCPHQTVIAGPEDAIAQAVQKLHAAGVMTERLPFDRPYHTPLFEAIARRLEPFFARWLTEAPRITTYSCTTMAPFPADTRQAREIAVEHWLRPLAFGKTIEAMYGDGVRIFVEVGPRGNLTAFLDDVLRGRPHLAVPANVMHRSGLTQLNHLVAMLSAHAVPMRLDYLYRHRAPAELDLARPDAPYRGAATRSKPLLLATGWPPMRLSEEKAAQLRSRLAAAIPARQTTAETQPMEMAVGAASAAPVSTARDESMGAVPPARIVSTTLPGNGPAPVTRPSAAPAVMMAHLRTMEQFLAVQQDVMHAFLAGQSPAAIAGTIAEPPVHAAWEGPALAPVLPPTPAPAGASMLPPERPVANGSQPARGNGDGTQARAPGGTLDAPALTAILVRLVSERTGYPPEMLGLNLDLEASLGVDSIKRVEILGLLRKETSLGQPVDMEALSSRKTLQGVIDLLAAPSTVAGRQGSEPAAVRSGQATLAMQASTSSAPVGPATSSALPFLRELVSLEPGVGLTARYEINLAEDRFLLDHTLGRTVSVTDPELRGLPVMPLTMSIEMLAEAAAAILPGLYLIGIRDVRANRWIALETERVTVRLVAAREATGGDRSVRVRLYLEDGTGSDTESAPVVEGTMVFGEHYPDAPPIGPFILDQDQKSKWSPEQLYSETMFHGPAFRGVSSIDRTGLDGAVATLVTRPNDRLFQSNASPALITDPVLLDLPGQVVGFWTAEHLVSGRVIFPFRVDALHLYGHMPDPGRRLECRARIELIGDRQVRSDLDVIDPDGRALLRFEGWEDQRFDVLDAFFRFLMSPQDVVLTQPWPAIAALRPDLGVQAYRIDLGAFPAGFFTAHGSIWQRVLAHLILSRRERLLWRGLEKPEAKRIEWLLGRLAAKDAVRLAVQEHLDLSLAPADCEILPDARGRPVVAGDWVKRTGTAFQVSLAHTANTAVAVATQSTASVGVDIEHVAHMLAGVGELAFTADEQALVRAASGNGTEDWPVRLWCAKEATAKAVGHGMSGGPQSFEARGLDRTRGTIEIALTGALARALPELSGKSLVVQTVREDDFVVALAASDPHA